MWWVILPISGGVAALGSLQPAPRSLALSAMSAPQTTVGKRGRAGLAAAGTVGVPEGAVASKNEIIGTRDAAGTDTLAHRPDVCLLTSVDNRRGTLTWIHKTCHTLVAGGLPPDPGTHLLRPLRP